MLLLLALGEGITLKILLGIQFVKKLLLNL